MTTVLFFLYHWLDPGKPANRFIYLFIYLVTALGDTQSLLLSWHYENIPFIDSMGNFSQSEINNWILMQTFPKSDFPDSSGKVTLHTRLQAPQSSQYRQVDFFEILSYHSQGFALSMCFLAVLHWVVNNEKY